MSDTTPGNTGGTYRDGTAPLGDHPTAGRLGRRSDQVDDGQPGVAHLGAAQGQATHGAQMVFELRAGCAFNRPMPRVVNTRRHFVDQEGVARSLPSGLIRDLATPDRALVLCVHG